MRESKRDGEYEWVFVNLLQFVRDLKMEILWGNLTQIFKSETSVGITFDSPFSLSIHIKAIDIFKKLNLPLKYLLNTSSFPQLTGIILVELSSSLSQISKTGF